MNDTTTLKLGLYRVHPTNIRVRVIHHTKIRVRVMHQVKIRVRVTHHTKIRVRVAHCVCLSTFSSCHTLFLEMKSSL